MNKFYEIKNQSAESVDVYIYGTISKYAWFDDSDDDIPEGASVKTVSQQIKALAGTSHINLYINSPGGDASEGIAIANWLGRQKFDIDVYIDALCASAATIIAFGCGGKVHIYNNAMCMIHNAWTTVCGANAVELRAMAERLEMFDRSILSTYLDKVDGKLSSNELKEMMSAETWLDADECLKYGFADEIITSASTVAACLPDEYLDQYKHIPECIKNSAASENTPTPVEMPESVKSLIASAKSTIERVSY